MTQQELFLLEKSSIFAGLTTEEIEKLCGCMGCQHRSYVDGEAIMLQGSRVTQAGILLKGQIRAESSGYGGERMVLSRLVPPAVFGDVLMAAQNRESASRSRCAPKSFKIRRMVFLETADFMFLPFMRPHLLSEIGSHEFRDIRRRMQEAPHVCRNQPLRRLQVRGFDRRA